MDQLDGLFGSDIVVVNRIVCTNVRTRLHGLLFFLFLHEDGRFRHELVLFVVEELLGDFRLILTGARKFGLLRLDECLFTRESFLFGSELLRDLTLVERLPAYKRQRSVIGTWTRCHILMVITALRATIILFFVGGLAHIFLFIVIRIIVLKSGLLALE